MWKQSRNNIGILFQNKRYFVHVVPLNDILECQATVSTMYIFVEKNRNMLYKMP